MRYLLSPRSLTLAAVAGVLFLVSVPRVHQLAVQDNERDAVAAVRFLITPVFGNEVHAAPAELPPTKTLGEGLRSRLGDVNYDPSTRLIRIHGYLMDVGRDTRGQAVIRAWPASHGRTGFQAYLYEPTRGLLSHPNTMADWTGSDSPRPDGTESGWESVPLRR